MDRKGEVDFKNRNSPVKRPPKGVFTPEVLLMADLVNEPETGIEPKKDPVKLDKPKAIISWVASTPFPFSARTNIPNE